MSNIFKQPLAIISVCGICMFGSAKADDTVYVNLSVLDGLNSAPISVSASQGPLFPVVQKKPRAQKTAESVKKVAPKIKEVKKEFVKKVVKNDKPEEKVLQPQIPYVESVEKVEVVDVEPASVKPEVSHSEDTTGSINIVPSSDAEVAKNITSVVKSQTVPSVEPTSEQASVLLVDENNLIDSSQAITKLTFLPDIDELTPEQQQQIDAAISSFEDAMANKIAIYAYNLDDGVDAFKRKRLSLNRAVAVRSYLLPKGYKNFSIKVVNVDYSSGKADTVELEEIKR